MSEHPVILFTRSSCAHCAEARGFLEERGVAYTEYDVGVDDEALRRLLWLTGRALVPAIAVRGEILVGFDADRLADLLDRMDDPVDALDTVTNHGDRPDDGELDALAEAIAEDTAERERD